MKQHDGPMPNQKKHRGNVMASMPNMIIDGSHAQSKETPRKRVTKTTKTRSRAWKEKKPKTEKTEKNREKTEKKPRKNKLLI